MPQYTDEQARESQERPVSEIYAYYENLAQQRRPAVERAIATLTGQKPATPAATPTIEESDLDDEPEPAPEVDDEPTAGDPEPGQ